jgi:carboxylate-amine ligase
MIMPDMYTLGVEEEYQLIQPETRELCGRADKVLKTAQRTAAGDCVQPEIHRCQIEIATDVCGSLSELRKELQRSRQVVIEAAEQQGVAVAAAGTHPFSLWQDQALTPKDRYQKLAQNLKQVIRELIIFGCHVHVGLNGDQFRQQPEVALEIVNRCRLWLSPLLALTANSPFWHAADTGYDSYRTELWCRMPTAGPPPHFESLASYESFVQTLIQSQVAPNPTMLYWDIRLSEAFPTIEFRIADVCMTIDEAVMLAGLIKALVRTTYGEVQAGGTYPAAKSELLKAAHWTAARYGVSADLIDLQQAIAVPARDHIAHLLAYLRPALEAEGDWDTVVPLVHQVLQQGNGAARQRRWLQETGSLHTLVDRLIAQTAAGVPTLALA